ncbi:MAG: hypothetical protein AAFQ32_00810 [Pseudomonadota bacterium]
MDERLVVLDRLGDREVLRLMLLVVLDRLGELYELPLMEDV